MTSKVDAQGRLVIPHAERERLGLMGGAEVELVRTPEGLALEPRRRAVLEQRDGLLVATVEGLGRVSNETVLAAIHAHREGTEP